MCSINGKSSYPSGYLKRSSECSDVTTWIDGKEVIIPYQPSLKKKRKKARGKNRPKNSHFYESKAWKKLRVRVLRMYGKQCMKCGDKEGIIQIDHIKPRSKYPELELIFSNMQVLCQPCNMEKSNKHQSDYRPEAKQCNANAALK